MIALSIQTGQPVTKGTDGAPDPMDRPWTSSIWKQPRPGSVTVSATGLEGDAQADLRVHGGPDKAVNAYPSEHFVYWRDTLGLEMTPGACGENITTKGALETNVCIGDVYRVGSALLQVSQPRQPCWKLDRKWSRAGFCGEVRDSRRTGWYFRVLEEGIIQAGDAFTLQERRNDAWSITAANDVYFSKPFAPDRARSLAACAELAMSWQTSLRQRLGD